MYIPHVFPLFDAVHGAAAIATASVVDKQFAPRIFYRYVRVNLNDS